MEGMKTPKPRDWFLIILQACHMADMYTVAVLSFSAGSPVPDTKGEQQGWEVPAGPCAHLFRLRKRDSKFCARQTIPVSRFLSWIP